MQNWAGNVNFQESKFVEVQSKTELQKVIESATKAKVVATGHSFSEIANTTGTLISLKKLDPEIEINSIEQTVSVSAGATYAQLAKYLEKNGWALPNLASLGEVTILSLFLIWSFCCKVCVI